MDKEKQKTKIIPPHGGYRKLKSYQIAEIIYDATVIGGFTERLYHKGDTGYKNLFLS